MNWLRDIKKKFFGPLSRTEAANIIDQMINGEVEDAVWDNLLRHDHADDADPLVREMAGECITVRTEYPSAPDGGWCSEAGMSRLAEIRDRLRTAELPSSE